MSHPPEFSAGQPVGIPPFWGAPPRPLGPPPTYGGGSTTDPGPPAPSTAPASGAAQFVQGRPHRPRVPVELRQYHEFWRTPHYRWWRGVLALLAMVVGFIVATVLIPGIAIGVDLANEAYTLEEWMDEALHGGLIVTPALFLANNLAIACAIPLAYLLQWGIVGQRPRWLASIAGGIRWRWLGLLVGALSVVWIAMTVIDVVAARPTDLRVDSSTVLLIVGILLTTPFQAAGEEYMMRGFATKAIASWFPQRAVGLVVAWIVTAIIFAALHGAGDPWLNVMYLTFATVASYVTWRTGGLEAAIAIHVVNNITAEALLPFSDISGMFDRDAGSAGPSILILVGVLLLAVVVVELLYRWRRPVLLLEAAAAQVREREHVIAPPREGQTVPIPRGHPAPASPAHVPPSASVPPPARPSGGPAESG